jgi:hypothetical protein
MASTKTSTHEEPPSKKRKVDAEEASSQYRNGRAIVEYILELYKQENIKKRLLTLFQTLDTEQKINLESIVDEQLQFLISNLFSKDQAIADKNWSHLVHQSRKNPLKFKKRSDSKSFVDKFNKIIHKEDPVPQQQISSAEEVQNGPTEEELKQWSSLYSYEEQKPVNTRLEKLLKQGYIYDEASGYYCHAEQQLYYDPITEYFYDTTQQCWMYEQEDKLVPVLAPSAPRQTYVPQEDNRLLISKPFTPSVKLLSTMHKIDRKEKPKKQTYKPQVHKMRQPSPEPAPEDIGSKMLKKLGWKEGEGLGKEKKGITEPISAHVRLDRTGIGHTGHSVHVEHFGKTQKKGTYHEKIRQKTVERYYQ